MGNRKVVGTCKLRGEENVPLVDSHIIPRNFFEPLKGAGGNRPILIWDSNLRAEYTQSGVYENFLCQSCEEMFGQWDSHRNAVLMAPYDSKNLMEPTVYYLPNFDYKKLKLFILSILLKLGIVLSVIMAPVFLNDFQKSYESKVWINLMMK